MHICLYLTILPNQFTGVNNTKSRHMYTNDERMDALLIRRLLKQRRLVPISEICKYIGKTKEGVMLVVMRLIKEKKAKLINNDSVADIEISITEIYY